MAWERRRGRSYYYRSVRQGDRVIKEYAGAGLAGELAATLDSQRQAERAEGRRRAAAERERRAALERPTAELDDWVGLLAAAALVLAGFRRHDRGEWRRQRERRPF